MQPSANWKTYHDRKLDWAYKARNNLVKDCKNNEIFYFEDQMNSEMLISVYGKSQRGKTTCILSLMGIKEEKVKMVTDTLRGSRKKGNSATSTATIYRKSENNFFGLYYNNLQIDDLSPEDFSLKIDEVREQIEKFPGSIEYITISLPNYHFLEDKNNQFKFKIVDLPGVESAEEREREHVIGIVNKYMKSSDSVIIVELANSLTDLGNISFARQGIDIWSKRFKVILTRSFSLESIQDLVIGKSESEIYDNLTTYYDSEVKRSLKGRIDENLEIYPMEFGESLNEFIAKFPEYMDPILSVLKRLKEEILHSVTESLTIEDRIMESVNMTNTIQKRVDKQSAVKKETLKSIEQKLQRVENYTTDPYGLKYTLNGEKRKLEQLGKFMDDLNEVKISISANDIKRISNPLIFYNHKSDVMYFEIREDKIVPAIKKHKLDLEMLTYQIKEELDTIQTENRDYFMELMLNGLVEENIERDSFKYAVINYYNLYSITDTETNIESLVDSFFSRKIFRQNLDADYITIYDDFLEEYTKVIFVNLKESFGILEKQMQVAYKNRKTQNLKRILEIENDINKKNKHLEEIRNERASTEHKYDEIIKKYKEDSEVVSNFHFYLTRAYKEEYNAAIRRINCNENPVLNLSYAKLITKKYQYFMDKLEYKYGR